MKKTSKLVVISIIFMTIFSLTSLFKIEIGGEEIGLASITLIIGIAVFFITRKTNDDVNEGLNFINIFSLLKDKKTFILMLIPTIMNVICFLIAKLFLPEFITHLKERTDFLSLNMILILLVQLIIFALGEEIAWRAFFQKQLSKIFPYVPSLIITAALFSLCHLNTGSIIVVIYDLLFVFINAVFYGIVFKRTDNACISTIAHFIANLFGTVTIMFL